MSDRVSDTRIVHHGPDTVLVNYKFCNEQGLPTGETLPAHIIDLFETLQDEARKEYQPLPIDLVYHGQTLYIRHHGDKLWSWLFFTDEIKLNFSRGNMQGRVFCQARFSSHLLLEIGPEACLQELDALLYSLMPEQFHKQMSEIHLCADVVGWDVAALGDWRSCFVSRVVRMRDRPEVPTEEELAGALSPEMIKKLEELIEQERLEWVHAPFLTTEHRRIATLDFGSHGSAISCQIYNKSAEVKKRKKEHFYPVWRANGWDGEATVWRIEFRFKRKFLQEFELNEAGDVLSRLEQLWRYATVQWLRYVDRSVSQSNISRLPTHPDWEVIQNAYTVPAEMVTRDAEGERAVRLEHVIECQPLQVLEQAVSLSIPEDESTHEPVTSVFALQETLSDVPLEVVRNLAREQITFLTPEQVNDLLEHLSPDSFREVQGTLVKRARRMAKVKQCLAGGIGYIRSAVALMPLDELPGYLGPKVCAGRRLPDLLSSFLWFADQARSYDEKKGRHHVEEVQKKRLAYGMVTAQELEEERRLYGVQMEPDDGSALRYLQQRLGEILGDKPFDETGLA